MNLNRIFLIGYMGSGKSTIGKLLAKKINWQFVDLDLFIEARYHNSIRQIFEEKGEPFFRKMESATLQEVSQFENTIISTGGGTPCFCNNMQLMKQSGITIYLKASVPELVSRLETCKQSRPLIKNKSKDELFLFINETLKIRDAFYNEASVIFDAEKMLTNADAEQIADQLITELKINNLIS